MIIGVVHPEDIWRSTYQLLVRGCIAYSIIQLVKLYDFSVVWLHYSKHVAKMGSASRPSNKGKMTVSAMHD